MDKDLLYIFHFSCKLDMGKTPFPKTVLANHFCHLPSMQIAVELL